MSDRRGPRQRALLTQHRPVSGLPNEPSRSGHVELIRNEHDRRIVQLRLTPLGRATLASARAEEAAWLTRLMADLDLREIEAAVRLLRNLRHRLLAAEQARTR
ncbi:MAG TPA: hypothetical protein VF322_01540 [Gammaproteobacteria bacterium]